LNRTGATALKKRMSLATIWRCCSSNYYKLS
jgi:hypothetical protein